MCGTKVSLALNAIQQNNYINDLYIINSIIIMKYDILL